MAAPMFEGGVIESPEESALRSRGVTGPSPIASPAPQDFVGRAKAWLTKEPPAGSNTVFGETDLPGRIIRGLGDVILPGSAPEAAGQLATLLIGGGPLSGPLLRAGVGGVVSGLTAAAQGRDPLSEGGKFAAGQGVADLLMSPLRLRANQKAFDAAHGSRAQEVTRLEGKHAFDTSMTKALNTLESQAHEGQVGKMKTDFQGSVAAFKDQVAGIKNKFKHDAAMTDALNQVDKQIHAGKVQEAQTTYKAALEDWRTRGAGEIAEEFKSKVPAWAGFPSTEEGLRSMVYGDGQARLSAAFDISLREAVKEAAGKTIRIPIEAAESLGLRRMGGNQAGMFPMPSSATIFRGGQKISSGFPQQDLNTVEVGAADAIQKVVGTWKKDPGTYRQVTNALVDAGVGNEEARAAYKSAQGMIQFTEKSALFDKEGRFTPENVMAGLVRLKKLSEIRRRGLGNVDEGPFARVASQRPPEVEIPPMGPLRPEPVMPELPRRPMEPTYPEAPTPRPSPVMPAMPPVPQGFETATMPKIPHPFWTGGAAAELPFMLLGQHGYGAPYAAGGLLSSLLSGQQFVTKAPGLQSLDDILRAAASISGQAPRRYEPSAE